MTIERYSSRRQNLGATYLADRLRDAKSYDRIAGYFSSSLLEVAGEAIESMSGPVRLVCNGDLDPSDVATATAAQAAIRQEWCASLPEALVDKAGQPVRARMLKLHDLLASGKLEVRVLPDMYYGLIHGKAGVITDRNDHKVSFLGSVNESKSAWQLNYELMWEDDDPESVAWVQEEFDALWNSPFAVPLGDFVVQDLARLAKRSLMTKLPEWKANPTGVASAPEPDPAPVFIESPVYRKQAGLWPHQKYFVELAFRAHLHAPGGARFVLADQVGLGKTAQLAMAAALMALVDDLPVLVLAPKTLVEQWQDDLRDLLDLPSAFWNGKQWIDERGVEYPAAGPTAIRKCPRRIGIVSTGLVTARTEAATQLESMHFACVILDEAHRARRRNLGPGCEREKADPNHLLAFIQKMAGRCRSMLLATATPVQIHPIEVWDLLDALNRHDAHAVLGGLLSSPWQRFPADALDLQARNLQNPPQDLADVWQWLAQPFPAATEDPVFASLRRSLKVLDSDVNLPADAWSRLGPPDQRRVRDLGPQLPNYSPFVRFVVRRSRNYLEQQIDPATGDPYLKPIHVELHGEDSGDALHLPPYLAGAYELAEKFCRMLGKRQKGAGFLKTLMLRRVGSTILAGRRTAERMLENWEEIDSEEDDANEDGDSTITGPINRAASTGPTLTTEERSVLESFLRELETNQDQDPKYAIVLRHLIRERWLDRGCIIFSQYFDSAEWLAQHLSVDLPDTSIGLYAGGNRSGLWLAGQFTAKPRADLKVMVQKGQLKLLIGTDAASEGLNLQKLGTLINLDLPWNPTRLEQRKGRIQRIGQIHDTVHVLNLRYRGSVEDHVHDLLSLRLKEIHQLFGQLPDVLEDVWVDVALGDVEHAKQRINAVPKKHPFELRYREPKAIDWESCERVLARDVRVAALRAGW